MRKFVVLGCILALAGAVAAQYRPAVIDSFKKKLTPDLSAEKRIEILGDIARLLIYVDIAESDKYGQEALETAEISRNRKLMVAALLSNAQRYSYLAGRKANTDKSISYYNKALEIARENKLDEEIAKTYLGLSTVHRFISDADKSLNYCNQAYSYVNTLKNDSLTAATHLEYGSVYLAKNEKILSLRNYLTGLRMAEELTNNELLRSAYSLLSEFYSKLEDYEKAIDYTVKGMDRLQYMPSGQSPYNRVQDLNRLGLLYSSKKSYELAMRYYEQSIALADSLKFEPLKVLSYRSIVNNYLDENQPQKALDYFNAHPQLTQFLQTVNFGHFIDQSYGYIYMKLGNYDSAKYFYNKAAPLFEKDVTAANQYSFYAQSGRLYRLTGELDKALQYFLLAKQKADETGNLDLMSFSAKYLDSLYQQKGDYKNALHYSSLHYQYEDSLAILSKEKDLMQAEAGDEQQRQARLSKEQEERKNRRHNIQYRVITIGIVALVIGLIMLGMFKVSATTIRMLGFFTFLFFFEFVFLLLKKKSSTLTEGEPWKDLLLMIVLAAVLLPLHHWLEHKVITYLTSHNRLTASGKGLLDRVFKKKKSPAK